MGYSSVYVLILAIIIAHDIADEFLMIFGDIVLLSLIISTSTTYSGHVLQYAEYPKISRCIFHYRSCVVFGI